MIKKILFSFILSVFATSSFALTNEEKKELKKQGYSEEQISAFLFYIEAHEEARADVISMLPKLDKATQCFFAPNKLQGQETTQGDNFIFNESKLVKKIVVCFDNEKLIMNSSDSLYIKLSDNTFISYKESPAELIEFIQLDHANNIIKYGKSLLIDQENPYKNINGMSIFIGKIYKIYPK